MGFKRDGKRNKTWELFYPDGTSSLMNYDPLKEAKRQRDKSWFKAVKMWLDSNEGYVIGDGLFIRFRRQIIGILKKNDYNKLKRKNESKS